MFLEKDSHNRTQGWIEVVCGSMFSGKTEELIRRLKRAKIAKLKVEIFKPGVDTRYSEEDVVSHNSTALHSIPVESAQEILFLHQQYRAHLKRKAKFLKRVEALKYHL